MQTIELGEYFKWGKYRTMVWYNKGSLQTFI